MILIKPKRIFVPIFVSRKLFGFLFLILFTYSLNSIGIAIISKFINSLYFKINKNSPKND